MRTLAVALLAVVSIGCRDATLGSPSNTPPSVEIETSSGIGMILIPGGTFRMGSDDGRPNESPAHQVELDAFVIDKFEATQDLLAELQLPDASQFKGARHPLEQVRWSDAAMICNERSRLEGLEPCYDEDTLECHFDASGYRLPTEAEWEYACRAGQSAATGYGFDGGESRLRSHACYAGNSGKRTRAVGTTRPNEWGVCDMHGNVAEWCHDVYVAEYYSKSSAANPRGAASGKERVIRGGSWASSADVCRSTYRSHADWGTTDACFSDNTVGFRCVRRPSEEERKKLAEAARGE
jgi:formylglycine-generating enzyme required for sulfatase activity